jgi:hypothetical protein
MQASGIPEAEDLGGYWLAKSHIRNEMAKWSFPYHFIDFETSSVALPFYAGMRPYEQIAFQFSHHLLHADGRVEHAGQFLMTEPGSFPNFEFARALKRELSQDNGTVFMWSPHEHTILTRIMRQLDESTKPQVDTNDLISFLRTLIKGGDRAMYDLFPLSRAAFFHTSTKGSSSIKKVLPAILSSSNFLKTEYSKAIYGAPNGIPSKNYTNYAWWVPGKNGELTDPYDLLKDYGSKLIGEPILEGEDPDDLVIAEGGAAATAYSRLQFEDLEISERSNINSALLRYCELDTLAMVRILDKIKQL